MTRAVFRGLAVRAGAALACILISLPALASEPPTVAGAFVYPVGDEEDFTKPAEGEPTGFYVSSKYLSTRGRKRQRLHYGVDLANGRGGSAVRAIASGVVVVSDANALVKYRKKERVKKTVMVDGKPVVKTVTRTRTGYRWRTGWGNRVVIRHVLPNGEVIHSLYAHLRPRSVRVKVGEVVAAGQVIARVGRTGRASAAHLHLEIRGSLPDPASMGPVEVDEASGEQAADSTSETGGPAETADVIASSANGTMDPMAFLDRHVARFDDLRPDTWQSRYALAACRDGILAGAGRKFDPDDGIRLKDFYAALVRAFLAPSTPASADFESCVSLGPSRVQGERADDRVRQSDALELVLRCLDRGAASGRALAAVEANTLCRDFNREFAGDETARQAESDAKAAALSETKARQKAARERYERDLRWVKKTGKKTKVRLAKVKPVPPVFTLDAGFVELAASDRDLKRAEAALLLASALRMDPKRLSLLERAARRADTTTASG
jgi:murein DD-endopeptidase MepM/ murein hydrolase activator NlpD